MALPASSRMEQAAKRAEGLRCRAADFTLLGHSLLHMPVRSREKRCSDVQSWAYNPEDPWVSENECWVPGRSPDLSHVTSVLFTWDSLRPSAFPPGQRAFVLEAVSRMKTEWTVVSSQPELKSVQSASGSVLRN